MDKELLDQINALIEECRDVVVCSVDENAVPNAKAMFKTKHNGLKTFLFSTNTASMRVQQFMANPKSCIYFSGISKINGLMLVGTMEVCADHETKASLWNAGDEIYYPLGIDDPDYSVLRFTAQHGNYYFNLKKHEFEVE